ncbi:MAG TPA: hydrogenase 3 maturation endopeptidase HyCI [Firmicutes bacterium]|nr:hydrogenase 3 maturation endopeptidase HyCI [Bacillota bacterium]
MLAKTPAKIAGQKPRPSEARPDWRIALVGMGNELNGDDAAGIEVVKKLVPVAASGRDRLLVLNAGLAPENFTGVLRRFAPDLVILIDAALMGEKPGTIRILPWEETQGLSASTHTMPPYMLARFLVEELDTSVALLGIEPADTSLWAPLSPAVQAAVAEAADGLAALLALAGAPPDEAPAE